MATPEQAARLHHQDLLVLGERIRDSRRAKGLGQADVGDAVGVSISFISRIESGKRRADVVLLEKIAAVLNAPLDALLGIASGNTVAPTPELARPTELEFATVALEMGDAASALRQLDALPIELPAALQREALLLRGRAYETEGSLERAIETLEQISLPGPNPVADVAVAITLCRCYREAGEVVRSIRVGETTLAFLKEAGLEGIDESVQLAVTVAAAYFEQGDREYAVRLCRRILAQAEAADSPRARASAYWNYAMMDFERGDAMAAVPMARRALALLSEGQDERNLGRLQGQLGLMELKLDPPDLDLAELHLNQGRVLMEGTSASQADLRRMDFALARLQLARGNNERARELALSVPEQLQGSVPYLEAEALTTAGEAALELGDSDEAHDHFLQAVRLLAGMDALRSVAQLWMDLGMRLQTLGDAAAAADAFQRAAVASGLSLNASRLTPAADRS